jgi:hypothetical protein
MAWRQNVLAPRHNVSDLFKDSDGSQTLKLVSEILRIRCTFALYHLLPKWHGIRKLCQLNVYPFFSCKPCSDGRIHTLSHGFSVLEEKERLRDSRRRQRVPSILINNKNNSYGCGLSVHSHLQIQVGRLCWYV